MVLSDFGVEMYAAAERYRTASFVNHIATAGCGGKVTTEQCMELGLGPTAFDCSGLVIRAVTDVMGWRTNDWASDIRHVDQMARTLPAKAHDLSLPPTAGDLIVYAHRHGDIEVPFAHIAICNGAYRVLHARNRDNADRTVGVEPIRGLGESKRFRQIIDPQSLLPHASSEI